MLTNGFVGVLKKGCKCVDTYRTDLMVVPFIADNKYFSKQFSVYHEAGKYILLPRGYATKMNIKYKLVDKHSKLLSTTMNLSTIENKLGIKLYDYQLKAISDSLGVDKLNKTVPKSGILKLGCGAGKTILSIVMAVLYGHKFIIVTDKDLMCDAWKNEIDKLGYKVLILSRFKYKPGSKLETVNEYTKRRNDEVMIKIKQCDVIICTYKSLTTDKFNSTNFFDFGTTIIDECHMYLTEMNIKLFYKVSRPWILGLSATPEKANKTEYLLNYFIGPIIFEYSNSYTGAPVTVIPIDFKSDKLQIIKKENKIMCTSTYIHISRIPERNELIIKLIVDCYDEIASDEQIIVIGLFRDQLDTLAMMLDKINKTNLITKNKFIESEQNLTTKDKFIKSEQNQNIDYGLYYSMNPKMLEINKKKKVILAVRQLGAQSLNLPGAKVLIMAGSYITKDMGDDKIRHSGSLEQLVGRIKRKKHLTSPLIIDIFDQIGFLKRHKKLRMNYYKTTEFYN